MEQPNKMMIDYLPPYLVFQNKDANLLNSLPYIEEDLNKNEKKEIDALVKAEMLTFKSNQ